VDFLAGLAKKRSKAAASQVNEDIGSYGLIGDLGTAALVSANGHLRWLCWPDFDSEACFASLLGTNDHGVWSLAPEIFQSGNQRYIPGTLVLETTYTQQQRGIVTVTDFMPKRNGHSCVMRIARGVKGKTRLRTRFAPRFDYGNAQPRLEQKEDGHWSAVTGPHHLTLRSNVELRPGNGDLTAEWNLDEGETAFFTLQYSNSYLESEPPALDPLQAEQETLEYWKQWSSKATYHGPYKEAVERSLLTLKALTYAASGAFVAAPTTSLPEKLGGARNWDYRFCWLRDTTFALLGLTHCGYSEEAKAWLEWLSRSIQGDPKTLKIMYGVTGKREHSEWEADWLPGYKSSRPVHVGNKASDQLQLDTFGEVLDSLYRARHHGVYPLEDRSGEALEVPLLKHLEEIWDKPDDGLWEMRSRRRHFTQSKVMAWVAFDRGIRMAEKFGLKGPVERWRKIRTRLHAQICKRGFHKGLNSFTLVYGEKHLDSSLLLLPLVGFLPIDDPRITGTVKAIEKHLLRNGLLLRYDTARVSDGLPAGEGAFLACNFWLVDIYILQGRQKEAQSFFEKLLGLGNHLGLFSEEYDDKHGLVGNFPQAFSHIGLIDAALALSLGVPPRLRELE
jgi:GH15 family glucan-1,4-alpha-glucosidase